MPHSVFTETYLTFAVAQMRRSERYINLCVDRLTNDQILHRGGEHENSVANLLLHLEGNIRQWILHGIDDQPDVRTRDEEFSLHPAIPIPEIRSRFASTLAEACTIISAIPDDRMLTKVDPQPGGGWEPMTILEVVFRIVGHLQLHTGQIILLTKQFARTDLNLSLPRKR